MSAPYEYHREAPGDHGKLLALWYEGEYVSVNTVERRHTNNPSCHEILVHYTDLDELIDALTTMRGTIRTRADIAREAEEGRIREWLDAVYPDCDAIERNEPISDKVRDRFRRSRDFFTIDVPF